MNRLPLTVRRTVAGEHRDIVEGAILTWRLWSEQIPPSFHQGSGPDGLVRVIESDRGFPEKMWFLVEHEAASFEVVLDNDHLRTLIPAFARIASDMEAQDPKLAGEPENIGPLLRGAAWR